jgi:hypothetical protein
MTHKQGPTVHYFEYMHSVNTAISKTANSTVHIVTKIRAGKQGWSSIRSRFTRFLYHPEGAEDYF